MKRSWVLWITWLAAVGIGSVATAVAQESPHKVTAQEVAEMLADPSANITYFNISHRAYMDVGPGEDMNQEMRLNGAGFLRMPDKSSLLYRAFLPLYSTQFPFDDEGVGDALLSSYWVPGSGSLILGYGGALMVPSASEDYYGTGKWSLGPTLVIAKKVPGKYSVGGLLTHVWSIGGDSDRDDVSMTTIQPAVTYFLNKKGSSLMIGSESTYNWEAENDAWQVPITVGFTQILPPIGMQFIGVGLAGSYYVEKPEYAQEWDVRVILSIVFP